MDATREILVVEDDETLNSIVCRFVAIAGFSARSALDGASALKLAKERAPAVVLLDLMLPDMTGFEVCQQLKGDQSTSGAPVVMVTALTDEESRQRGMQCGAVDYLTKPFDPDQLIEAIKKHAA
jgi:DNA-binding response OmpR family regulator